MTLNHARAGRVLALAAVVSTLAAPSASARPVEEVLPHARGESDVQAIPVRVVEVRADRGFDWGDAAIGATGVLALAAIGAGAALASGRGPRFGHTPQPSR